MVALGSKDQLLWLFGHEFMEAAIAQRPGYDDEDEAPARAFWKEYAVERARREVANGLGWGASDLECAFLSQIGSEIRMRLRQARDNPRAAHTAGSIYPDQALREWNNTVIDFAKTCARADAELAGEKAQLESFMSEAVIVPTADAWTGYANALRGVYAQPDRPAMEHDAVVERWWEELSDAFRLIWRGLDA